MKLVRVLLVLFLFALIAAGVVYYSLSQPYAGFRDQVFIELPRGTPTQGMAAALAQAGVIRYGWQFLAVRALQPHRRLQAGEYLFDRPASVFQVFDRIARGDIFYYTLVVPEGQNMFDIAASVEQLGILPAAAFLQAARDPASIRELDPQAPTLEGYLFPETYRITRRQDAASICRMMTGRFRLVWSELGSPPGVHAVVTLASLVEKETAIREERPLVASVFRNRLAIGMKLDCDPTTVYAAMLSGTYRGSIFRSDLESPNPYNTYRNAGLPPGPIANPGLASLRAALKPAESDYLYFVARGDGSGHHQFSQDLAAHRIATAQYRRANQSPKSEEAEDVHPKTGNKAAPAGVSGGKKASRHR